jgi:hypothetical protein
LKKKKKKKNKLDAVTVSALLLLLIILIIAAGIVTLQPLSLLCYVLLNLKQMEKERVLVSPLLFYALAALFSILEWIYTTN